MTVRICSECRKPVTHCHPLTRTCGAICSRARRLRIAREESAVWYAKPENRLKKLRAMYGDRGGLKPPL